MTTARTSTSSPDSSANTKEPGGEPSRIATPVRQDLFELWYVADVYDDVDVFVRSGLRLQECVDAPSTVEPYRDRSILDQLEQLDERRCFLYAIPPYFAAGVSPNRTEAPPCGVLTQSDDRVDRSCNISRKASIASMAA